MLARDDPKIVFNGIGNHMENLTRELRGLGVEVGWALGGTDKGTLDMGGEIKDCDLVHAMSLPYGAKVRKLPMVAVCHSPLTEESQYYPWKKRIIATFATRFEVDTLKFAKAVITRSQFAKELLRYHPYFKEHGVSVIHEGVDSEKFRPMKGDNFQAIVWCGRKFDKRKGYGEFLKIASHFQSTSWFVLLGDSPPGLAKDSFCTGDIYLSTSKSEGFDQGLLQAMSAGCACVISDIPAHRELITNGVEGIIYEDERDAVDNMRLLLDSKQLRELHGNMARQKALNYTWKKAARETLAVYQRVLGSSPEFPEARLAA